MKSVLLSRVCSLLHGATDLKRNPIHLLMHALNGCKIYLIIDSNEVMCRVCGHLYIFLFDRDCVLALIVTDMCCSLYSTFETIISAN